MAESLLEGRVVLVSGGTQGVGAGIARAVVEEGGSVVVSGRTVGRGTELVDALGDRATSS